MGDRQIERFNHAMEVCEGMLDMSKVPEGRTRECWLPIEVEILVDWIYEKGVHDWHGCAAAIGTKSAKQCCDKYRNMRTRTLRNLDKAEELKKRYKEDEDKENGSGVCAN